MLALQRPVFLINCIVSGHFLHETHTMNQRVRWQDIHNRMTRRGIPAQLVSAAVEAHKQRVSDAKRQRLFERQHRLLWAKLMRPLMYELDSARTGLTYARHNTPGNTLKIEALEGYTLVLEELAMRLTEHRDDKVHTPSQLAKAYNNEFKKRAKGHFVPNHGEHWTDWVPRHIKLRVSDLFAFAPRAPRAKPRLPFQRTMPPSMNSRAESALRKRILNEMGPLKLLLETYPDPEHPDRDKWQAKLGQMTKALTILDAMKPRDFVPTTWQSLVGAQLDVPESEEELEQSFRDAHAGRDEE